MQPIAPVSPASEHRSYRRRRLLRQFIRQRALTFVARTGLLVFLAGIAAGTIDAIAARNREITKLGVIREICFKPTGVTEVDAGSGGELRAFSPPAGWQWTAVAAYHPTGTSNKEEDVSLCGASDPLIGNPFKAELEPMLTSRTLTKIANDCRAPPP